MGAVIHTINPRLFPDQIAYIANHAEDKVVFFDLTFAPLVEKLAGSCKSVKGWVAMTDRAHMPQISCPNSLCYEELIAPRRRITSGRVFDERHRGVPLLHLGHDRQPEGRAVLAPLDAASTPTPRRCPTRSTSRRATSILPVVPMFHVNAWGLPYVGAADRREAGVSRRRQLDGKSLLRAVRGGEGRR